MLDVVDGWLEQDLEAFERNGHSFKWFGFCGIVEIEVECFEFSIVGDPLCCTQQGFKLLLVRIRALASACGGLDVGRDAEGVIHLVVVVDCAG